jgi:hypothetical protein
MCHSKCTLIGLIPELEANNDRFFVLLSFVKKIPINGIEIDT